MTSTVYDDVFRTLLNDCPELIIPILNEMFGEKYSGDEVIEFKPNEHFLERQGGEEEKRITDTYFVIHGKITKTYHLECQSTNDGTILIRIFEYDSQIALDNAILKDNVLHVKFPNSGILFLRSNSKTPKFMKIEVEFPNGRFSYEVPVLKVKDYSIKEIFEKNLLFLIPFYIFTHEKRFKIYENDSEKLQKLLEECRTITDKLEKLMLDGTIDEYTRAAIQNMSGNIINFIARNYSHVKDGAKTIMVGKILDYEAKDILNRGFDQGRAQGIVQGEFRMLFKLVRNNMISLKDASKIVNLSEKEFLEKMNLS